MDDLSPEVVVENAFAAFRRRDANTLAELAAPESLDVYRKAVHSDIQRHPGELTAEDMLRQYPDMPVEAAEWNVRLWQSRHDSHESELLRRFPGTADVAELLELDSTELLRRAVRSVPDEAIAIGHVVVLGHVRADDQAYVLFWLGTAAEGPIRFGHPEVATLTLTDKGWRLLLHPYSPVGMPGLMDKGFVGPSESIEPRDPSTEEG